MSSQIIPVEPFDYVVFGGTGDLAERKLLPALYHRQLAGQLSDPTRIIGASRTAFTDEEYRKFAVDALKEQHAESARIIRLKIERSVSAHDQSPCVRVEVSDNGPGISPAQLQRMFEAFQSTKPDGLGFGLAIARSIIEAHHGRIQADSPACGGARFWFELPRSLQQHEPIPHAHAHGKRHRLRAR